MKESVKKPRSAPSQVNQAPQSTVGTEIPNSVYLGIMGSGTSAGVDGFEEKMMARMQQFRDNQRAGAEREADSIAAEIDPHASLSEVKSRLGARLGADFSDVRIHTDAAARERADSIGAEAYTQGKDVYFGSEGVNAQTVAHELVHTVQQGEVAGTGVTESAPAGTVQMKPGMFSRIKKWFKKKFGKEQAPAPEEPTVAEPTKKSYKPVVGGTDIFNNMNKSDKINELEYYKDSDPNRGADVVDAGEYDSQFDDLEHADKVRELQKLSVYLSSKRKLMGEKGMDENDMKLQQTYYSSLQKASSDRDFLMELMTQAGDAGNKLSKIHNKTFDDNLADSEAYEQTLAPAVSEEEMKGMTPEQTAEAKKQNDLRYKQVKARSQQHKLNHYQNEIVSDEGIGFNALRFMLGDAANLMTDGNNRNWFNEKRRLHFSKKRNVKGDIVNDESGVAHAGQLNEMRGDGSIVKSHTAQFVADMSDANSKFSSANSAMASGSTEGKAMMEKALRKNIESYQLPTKKKK